MATLNQAKNARDRIADGLLDGRLVHSVGVEADGDDYSVGITASGPVNLPEMPPELAEVDVRIVFTSGQVVAQSTTSNRLLDLLRSLRSKLMSRA